MRRIFDSLVCAAICCSLGACFQADVGAVLFEDGAGKFDVVLSVNSKKLPPMLGDPLAGVGEVSDLKRYTTRGIKAWAKPERVSAGGWERVYLTAYFDDISEVRFLRRRGDEVVELLGFDHDAGRPGRLGMRVDMEPELAEPLPLPEREGLELSPDLLRQLLSMFKPMMGDLRMSLSFKTPGSIERASGFREWEGRVAQIVAGRDEVFDALQNEAGSLLDRESFLAEGAGIDWDASASTPPDERARYDVKRRAADEWWAAASGR